MDIQADLETSTLELKTDGSIGSYEKVDVEFLNDYSSSAGGVLLDFTSPPQYTLKDCIYFRTDFSNEIPTETNKVWRITLIKTSGIRLVIHCNEVEVLNILMSYSTCRDSHHGSWDIDWGKDVEKIRFGSSDTASDSYRLRGTYLIHADMYIDNSSVDNSNQ